MVREQKVIFSWQSLDVQKVKSDINTPSFISNYFSLFSSFLFFSLSPLSSSFCLQLLFLSFLLTSPFLTSLRLDVGTRWSSNSVYREPAFTTSDANRQVSSAFCPTEGIPLFPSVLLSITPISNGFICRKPSTLHRLPLWALLASPSFLLPVFDVCSTSSLLLSRHFRDNWFTQR